MNWETLKVDWKQFTGRIREQWGDLSDDEVELARGKRDQFEVVLQEKYGLGREEAKRQINEFEKSCDC